MSLFAEISYDWRRTPSRDRNEIACDCNFKICDHDFDGAPVVRPFHSPQLGGFAALGAFMALLSDTESDLISRLGGVAITFVGVMCAALLGVVLKTWSTANGWSSHWSVLARTW